LLTSYSFLFLLITSFFADVKKHFYHPSTTIYFWRLFFKNNILSFVKLWDEKWSNQGIISFLPTFPWGINFIGNVVNNPPLIGLPI
jgi:hypothetical protein